MTNSAQQTVTTSDDSGRWLVLAILSLGVMLSLATWFSTTAIAPELKLAWNLADNKAAWLTNAVQFGFVSGAVIFSLFNLPDIVQLNKLMALAAAIAGLANTGLLLEPGFAGAFMVRFATGAALAAVYPPALKLISTWFQRQRGLALGLVIGALSLGSAMPHLFRAIGRTFPWEGIVLATSLSTFLGAAIFLIFAREGPFPFSKAVFDPRQIGMVFRNRSLLLANIGYLGHMWELYAMWAWLLAYLRAASPLGQAPLLQNPSVLTFLAIAAGIPGCIAGGYVADRIGRSLTTASLMMMSGLCALLAGFAFGGPLWLLAIIVIIWGFTIIADSAQFSAAVTELANPSFVGTALTVQMAMGFALTTCSIWLLPILAGWLGSWQWVFLVLVPGPAIGATAMLALHRRPDATRLANGKR